MRQKSALHRNVLVDARVMLANAALSKRSESRWHADDSDDLLAAARFTAAAAGQKTR